MSQQDSLFQEPGATGPVAASTNASAQPIPGGSTRGDDLSRELKAAQRTVFNLLILLLVVSGTLSIFLLQQVRHDRADLTGLRLQEQQLEQAHQAIANYNEQTVPAVRQFLQQLSSYAQAHPDVIPILMKYGLTESSATPAGAAAGQER
jgi:hypothetical protein